MYKEDETDKWRLSIECVEKRLSQIDIISKGPFGPDHRQDPRLA